VTITDLTDITVSAEAPATVSPAQIRWTLTATAPIHHGAGTAGNTALLRTQEILLPDGTQTAVPFISGNSIRHAIRDALAWRLVRALALPEGSLSKAQVDLLWSGGALTKTGSQVELDQARRWTALIPSLGLLGYSAQSDIVTGALRVDNLNLVCAENAWRLPAHLVGHPHAAIPAGRFRGEEFGTRHDITGTGVDILVASGMVAPPTNQMIYEHQVLLPGSTLWGALWMEAATAVQVDALHAALHSIAGDGTMHVGARRSSGFGGCRVTISTDLDESATARHDTHLAEHRDDILAALAEATA
jgi:hypothetical protein